MSKHKKLEEGWEEVQYLKIKCENVLAQLVSLSLYYKCCIEFVSSESKKSALHFLKIICLDLVVDNNKNFLEKIEVQKKVKAITLLCNHIFKH